ncbi:3-oxoadipate enol-lactonase [Falsiroseomonas stagni]|uniref:3-oxoadipate enol-lactonase / 4-carboxymuconolactone decarboxylase n=1 Tax=Falsiroseomonas stagni DSM 19981 TaxID=1123062 RepID=A0A1I4F663_9PROT|nr:3-oxoadipate enol-lactonase [Falsiroseomonas stagni]SFL12943.1 3-oxoadipate enol-lactonase / 4-carboxymuconolactone decarboxylase [Falsiroseomonas stagni DSM 19981]
MFLDLRDLTMHVRLDGPADAPPLVLLHSLGTDLRVWDPQANILARSFRVARPDLRGHGLTDVPPGPYSIDGMARDVLALLDTLDLPHVHVAGLSIGGMVAQVLAAQAPDRVASLVLCDTAMAIPPPELWRGRAATVRGHGMAAIADAVLARWVTPGFARTPEARGLLSMLLRTAPEGYAGAAEAIAAADLTETTRGLRMPALVLVGEHDEATPRTSAEVLRDAIPGAELKMIMGAAHIPTLERPNAVAEAILGFLSVDAECGARTADASHAMSASGDNHD